MTDGLPFSQTVPAASIPRTGQTTVLRVTAAQREAIAAFLDLPAVDSMEAVVTVAPSRGGSFHVTGEVTASVQQLCGVSLEPFPTAVKESIDARFAPPGRLDPVLKKEVERTLEDEDPPEPLLDGLIDLGALAVEALALGLAPYPRKPGIAVPEMGDNDRSESPFAALIALKKPSAS